MPAIWNEEDAYLVAERAHLWAMQGQLQEAATLFAGLVAAAPGYHYARRSLAAIYLQLDRPAEALNLLEAVPALGQDWEARRIHLEALLNLGRRRQAEAVFASMRAGLDPSLAERYILRLESLPR